MDVRLTLAIALLCSTVLAGCVEEPQAIALSAVDAEPDPDPLDAQPVDDAPDADEETADANEPVTNGTEGEEELPPQPVPPVPSLALAAQGQFAPLPVEITVDATDEDGDLVSWTLLVGGRTLNGTEFPSVVSHTFEEPGSHNVTLRVVDGANQTANVTQQVVVVEDPFPYTATATMSCIPCSFRDDACASLTAGVPGGDCTWFELPEGSAGRTFTVTSDFALGDPEVQFYTECVPGEAKEFVASEGSETGQVPPDRGCLLVWEYAGGPSTFTLTIA